MKKKAHFFKRASSVVANVFVEGIGLTTNTAQLMADLLRLSNGLDPMPVSEIKNFQVIGSDVSFFIEINYAIGSGAFKANLDIISYIDEGGFCKRIGGSSTQNGAFESSSVQLVKFESVSYADRESFYNCDSLSSLVMPNLTISGAVDCLRLLYSSQNMINVNLPQLSKVTDSMFRSGGVKGGFEVPLATSIDDGAFRSSFFIYLYFPNVVTMGTICFSYLLNYNCIWELPNLTTVGNNWIAYRSRWWKCRMPKLTYLPQTALGNLASPSAGHSRINVASCDNFNNDNTVVNNVFVGVPSYCTIYTHPNNQTNGSGGGEASDIAYARGRGCTIVYVTNFDEPNAVNDLTVTNLTSDGFDVNFTPPPINTNANDFYDVFVTINDLEFPFTTIVAEVVNSGDTVNLITRLRTHFPNNKDFTVKLRTSDIFNNVSGFSNSVNIILP